MSLATKMLGTLAPSLFAATLATTLVGVLEALVYGSGVYYTLASAGFLTAIALPVVLFLALAARGLVHAWRVDELLETFREDSGSAPRLAAALFAFLAGLGFLAVLSGLGLGLIASKTKTVTVIAIGGALWVAVVAALALALTRPLILLLTSLLRRVDARRERPLLTPRRVLAGASVALAAALLIGWFAGVSPRIGHLELTPFLLVFGLLGGVVALHVAWRRIARPVRLVAAALTMVGLAATVATSLHARRNNVETLLQIWGQQPLAGKSIDLLFDVPGLVEARDREAIAPRAIASSHPDIILVTFDTVRADHTPVYGGEAQMPELAKLAATGTVFEWAFAAGNVTRRSLSTIATGLSPRRVRGRVAGWSLKIDPRHVLLAERLRAVGYDTAGFFWSDAFFGEGRFGTGIDYAEFSRKGDAYLAKRARDWMRHRAKSSKRPLFLWVHFFDPHNWKTGDGKAPDGLGVKERRLWRYDNAMSEVDRALGVVLSGSGRLRNPDGQVVIVTADHGEGLGDHGATYHSTDLYNSQLRVPLVVAGRGVAAGRVRMPVGHADIAPTILELAGYQPISMPEADGRSLAAVIRGAGGDDPDTSVVHASMVKDRSVKERADAIIVGRYKYIETSEGAELYDVRADPDEQDNIAGQRADVLARLEAILKERRARETISPFLRPR